MNKKYARILKRNGNGNSPACFHLHSSIRGGMRARK